MMPDNSILQVRCGGCQILLKVSSESIGKTIACPKCGNKMKLAKPTSSPPPEQVVEVGFPDVKQDDLFGLPATSYSMPSVANKGVAGSKKRSTPWPLIVGIAGAGAVLLFLATVGVIFLSTMIKGPNVTASAPQKNPPALPANSPTTTQSISKLKPTLSDAFPKLGPWLPFGNTEILYQRVVIPRSVNSRLNLNIFMPKGNDDNEPFTQTKTYVNAFQKAGGKITFLEFEREGHYQPLLDAGIPKAIEWLKQ